LYTGLVARHRAQTKAPPHLAVPAGLVYQVVRLETRFLGGENPGFSAKERFLWNWNRE